MNTQLPWTIAAPSFVWPARVGENCHRLKNMVDEVAVTLFETRGSLEYTDEDLPPDLAGLDLSYNVHLPLDLPWTEGAEEVYGNIRALAAKMDFLRPHSFVLHPPGDDRELERLIHLWSGSRNPESLSLENVEGDDLRDHWPLIRETGCRVCLDLGHLLAYGQESLLETPGLLGQTSVLHLYAPGPNGEHDTLSRLDDHGFRLLQHVLHNMPASSVIVLELFHPEKFSESLDIFRSWFRNGYLAR
ncbi:MAG: cobamide remodeling phosphodiesterase CbiR [Desulfohalobiaceae bacterium]